MSSLYNFDKLKKKSTAIYDRCMDKTETINNSIYEIYTHLRVTCLVIEHICSNLTYTFM